MSNPLVSVVMCEHNTHVEFLKEAVESILNQTYSNFELIFVDDKSNTDYSSLQCFKDKRIRLIKNEQNIGLAASRNVGIDASKGKYIAIMDTDDIAEPQRFEKQVEFMENNDKVVVCGTWFKMFGDKTATIRRIIDDTEYYRCCLLFGNDPTVLNPSTMIRKSTLVDNGVRLDERLKTAEDYRLWTMISKYGEVTNLKEILMNYRIRKGQMSEVNRTRDLSNNGWLIIGTQLRDLGMQIDEAKEKFIRTNFESKKVKAYKYFKFLKEISNLNKESKIYNQEKLDKRIRYQWVQKIYCTKNIFSIIKLFFQLPFGEKWFLIKTEFGRLNRKKMKREAENENKCY